MGGDRWIACVLANGAIYMCSIVGGKTMAVTPNAVLSRVSHETNRKHRASPPASAPASYYEPDFLLPRLPA